MEIPTNYGIRVVLWVAIVMLAFMALIAPRDVVSMMLILSIWTTRKLCHMQFSTLRFFIRICLEKMLPTQIYQVHMCRSPMVCIPLVRENGQSDFLICMERIGP